MNGNVYDFNKMKNLKPSVLFFILLFVFLFFSKIFIVVGAGERVVVFNSFVGVEQRSLGEGLHILVPFVQTPIRYNVKTRSYTMSSAREGGYDYSGAKGIQALTSDGQKVEIDLSIIYNLEPNEVWQLHKNIGPDYLNRILRPQVRSIVRNIVATYPVMDLYSEKRLDVQKKVQEEVQKALDNYYINVPEVLIRTVTFSEEFAKAVEQKQVALQEAERMKYVLQKAKQEKERKIIEAEGEAEAMRKKAQVLRANPALIKYEYVNKITPGIKTIVTDQKTIMNFSKEVLQ